MLASVTKQIIIMLQAPEAEQEDDDDWVQEQIRKGVGGAAPQAPPQPTDPASSLQGMRLDPGPVLGTKAAQEGVIASGEAALKALQQSVQRLKVCSLRCLGQQLAVYLFLELISGLFGFLA